MKRVSILFVSVMIALVSFAQPQAGSFGVELNFDPFKALEPSFSVDGLKVRYFISDNMAVRGTLNFSMAPETNFSYINNGTKDVEYKEKSSLTTFGIAPGFEYHFVNFQKGSVYGGAELGFSITSASYNLTNDDDGAKTEVKGSNQPIGQNGDRSNFRFGVGVFTGVDYYITSNLYIGAELGLAFNTEKTKEIVQKDTPATGSAVETTVKNYTKEAGLNFYAVPSFRIGWTF